MKSCNVQTYTLLNTFNVQQYLGISASPAKLQLIGVSFCKFLHTFSFDKIHHLVGLPSEIRRVERGGEYNKTVRRLSSVFQLCFPNHQVGGRRVQGTDSLERIHPTTREQNTSVNTGKPQTSLQQTASMCLCSWYSPRTREGLLNIQQLGKGTFKYSALHCG